MKFLPVWKLIGFFMWLCLSLAVFALDGETANGDLIEVEDRTDWQKGDSVEIYDPDAGEYRDADVTDVRELPRGRHEIELEDERDGETITVETSADH